MGRNWIRKKGIVKRRKMVAKERGGEMGKGERRNEEEEGRMKTGGRKKVEVRERKREEGI